MIAWIVDPTPAWDFSGKRKRPTLRLVKLKRSAWSRVRRHVGLAVVGLGCFLGLVAAGVASVWVVAWIVVRALIEIWRIRL